VHHLVLAWAQARLYIVTVVMSIVVEALTSIARLPWEGACLLEGQAARVALLCGALTLNVSRGVVMGYYACCTVPGCTFLQLKDKVEKSWNLTGARSPIMLPVTVGLGGSMTVALNALASVPATGGGGTLLRSRLSNSLNALSVIDGHWLSSLEPFARPYFRARGWGRYRVVGRAAALAVLCLH